LSLEEETLMPIVRSKVQIAARKEDVWQVLADFGAIEKWSPIVLRSYSTTEVHEGVGAARHCDLFPRGTVEEQVVEWEPGRHIGINVDPAGPIASQRADFDVAESGAQVDVTMAITFELRPGVADRDGRIESALQSAAQASVAGLKYYIEKGVAVGTEVPASAT
jgi:hypothetical protein